MHPFRISLVACSLAMVTTFLGSSASAESSTDCELGSGSPTDLKEIQAGSHKGLLKGYLEPDSLPDSLKLLAAPPKKDSAALTLMLTLQKTLFYFKEVRVGSWLDATQILISQQLLGFIPALWGFKLARKIRPSYTPC
jgi:hypothetical protein